MPRRSRSCAVGWTASRWPSSSQPDAAACFRRGPCSERLGTALDVGSGAADLPARQRTLRDTLAWSEQLLEPQQRSLLAALSVFAAPWTLSDAEQVAPPEVRDVLEDVAALVENSLVSPGDGTGRTPVPDLRHRQGVRRRAAGRQRGARPR